MGNQSTGSKYKSTCSPLPGENEAQGQSARLKPSLEIHKTSDCPMTEKKTAGARGPLRAREVPLHHGAPPTGLGLQVTLISPVSVR